MPCPFKCYTLIGAMNALNTLTIDEAVNLVPAIGAEHPAKQVSDRYQFVSSRDILNRVQQEGWHITNATAQGRSPYAQHRVTLVHESNLEIDNIRGEEGIPRIEMFNSHNRTKRLMFAIGFFRFVCSNGLIVASGPSETIRTKHRFSDDRLEEIMGQVSHISGKFPEIANTIENFKSRTLNPAEQKEFAKYALVGRFLYRPEMPKRYANDISRATEKLLEHRRDADQGDSTWQVYNRVQENMINGMEGFFRPIKGYSDSVRVNQLLWKGAETTLNFDGAKLSKALSDLLAKDGKKGKIAA